MLAGLMTREGAGQEFYQLLNLHQLAIKLGVSYGEAQRYLARGVLVANGEDGKGRPLFFTGRLQEFQNRVAVAKEDE